MPGMRQWLFQLLRPTKSKLILLIPFYISSIILKYLFLVIMLSAKALPSGLSELIGIPSFYLMKLTAAGTTFVLWLDRFFYITDGKGSIISRPEIMLFLLKYRFILDIAWVYLLMCLIHHFFMRTQQNKKDKEYAPS